MNDENEDENPWDEEDAGRTLATASPSFESNIPSPITAPPPAPVPPPPLAPSAAPAPANPPSPPAVARAVGAVRPMHPANKPVPKATLVGLNPADFMKSLPRAGSQPRLPAAVGNAAAAVAPRFPTPTPAPSSVSGSTRVPDPPRLHDDEEEDDGPTMLGVRAPSEPLGDSDLPPRSAGAFHDKDAETMALDLDPRPHDRLADRASLEEKEETEETTKIGAHARELHRLQDAHVIVGHGAVGDEATLAIPASAAGDLGLLPDPSTLGPPLPPQTPPQPAVQHQPAPQTPRLAAGGDPVSPLEQTHLSPERWQSPPWQPPQSQPQPWQQSVAPLQPTPFQQQGGMPMPPPPPFPPQGWNPQQASMTPFTPPAPPAPVAAVAPGFRLTPQIMVLAAVGVVCLAIFVIGIVLFVTTKF